MDNEGRAEVSEEKGNREIFVGIWFLSAYIYACSKLLCWVGFAGIYCPADEFLQFCIFDITL